MIDEDKEINGDVTSVLEESPELNGKVSSKLTDKREEEIADFFFYIKEREMLYGDGSILSIFKEIVERMCMPIDDNVQVVTYTSLYKLMCISSEFIIDHYEIFIQSLQNSYPRIRVNSVVAI